MSQDTDGSTLISLLWLAWFYWSMLSYLNQTPPDEKNQKKSPREIVTMDSNAGLVSAPATDLAHRAAYCGNAAIEDAEVFSALAEIRRQDLAFELASFLEGAWAAYEEITTAFARGDRERLHGAVSPEVYDVFAAAIVERELRGEETETAFVRIEPPQIVDARIEHDQAEISVRFASELIRVTRSYTGTVTDGDPAVSAVTADIWTFAKPVRSRNPAWTLVAVNAA